MNGGESISGSWSSLDLVLNFNFFKVYLQYTTQNQVHKIPFALAYFIQSPNTIQSFVFHFKENMRFLIFSTAAFAVLSVVSAGTVVSRPSRALVDEARWKVESESDDHITYVRRPIVEPPTEPPTDVDCNKTTTTAAPPSRRRIGSKSRLEARSGVEGSGQRMRGNRHQSSGVATAETTSPVMNYEGGDHSWLVSRRTDDHITYKRRGSGNYSTSMYGQGQPGELRRIGSGRDSVLARVVVPGKEEEYTEEALLEGSSKSSSSGFSGYPTNELVHPYVRKSKVPTTPTPNRSNRTKSLKSVRGGWKSKSAPTTSSSPPDVATGHEDHPPRVGEVVNGWVVVSKSKDHISWDRVGATPSSSSQASSSVNPAAVANLQTRNAQNENRLRSLKASRSGADTRNKSFRSKLIPNPEGQLVEGFPRVFNTYSRAFYINDRNIDAAGSIRTSLSDTSNWNVGDELAGWRVISKDHRGIVWQRMPVVSPTEETGVHINEEDLLTKLNKKTGDEESSESDSSSDSESNEGDNVYRGPPGTWYLHKETKNSITWKRDNTPEDVVFEMGAYPRIGDVQSGWKVKSKSREHITWNRINSDGSEVDSNEKEA